VTGRRFAVVNGNGSNISNHKVVTALSNVHKDHISSKLSRNVGRTIATKESCQNLVKNIVEVPPEKQPCLGERVENLFIFGVKRANLKSDFVLNFLGL